MQFSQEALQPGISYQGVFNRSLLHTHFVLKPSSLKQIKKISF